MFWQEERTLLISAPDLPLAGNIEFIKPVGYEDAFELSYDIYDSAFDGCGDVTEAFQLLT